VGQQKTPGEKILTSKIYVGLQQLSARQQKVLLGLIKEMGFAKEEIEELVIRIGEPDVAGSE
jgi:hypothetical protein